MDLFSNFEISASALTAERIRMDCITENLANVETTRTASGGPYKKKSVLIGEKQGYKGFRNFKEIMKAKKNGTYFGGKGVEVKGITEDKSAVRKAYMPGHPDADKTGYVSYPDINIIDEMIEMMKAARLYEANITAINEAKTIYQKSLEIGRT